ncbi:PBS lyase HEAT-like repeat-containing protein [Halogranum gelatinilyticum]|uniref:PBS lyase HEAT-like repeat-containing protein n=1 Tax=Halogranum gelatinilyticum TaxID=660521 RepID=A0A1G9R6W4_9EURY|nr:HEAT repeat domain-containing protein [Halogranum gelatinilyticum]SDM19016.1 PBS lyase HEAT-like repeat-containing protein [Halogranum gelatinilyticum]
MSDGDDASDDSGAPEEEISVESLQDGLSAVEEELEAAETEAALDEVESTLDDIESKLEAADLPEPADDDEEDPSEELADSLATLREELEAKRGPYAEDVVAAIDEAKTKIEDTRWTDRGEGEIVEAVESFVASVNETLDADVSVDGEDAEELSAALADAADVVGSAGLDADEDAETIAALVEAADSLESDLEAAQEWDDLETREKLEAQGFYDVLGHYKDYPPEWAAVKGWEEEGNVEMILLALDNLQSDFMERHCIESLTRLNDQAAFEAMHQRAQKRDKPSIKALGKMRAEDAVETLIEYVDTDKDPQLQKVTFKALGEIGDERATQPLADKLVMENDNVRPYAARALGLLGDTRAVEPLIDTLRDDESDSVRSSAAWALRQIGTQVALEAAAEHVDDRSYLVQSEAEKAREALGISQTA